MTTPTTVRPAAGPLIRAAGDLLRRQGWRAERPERHRNDLGRTLMGALLHCARRDGAGAEDVDTAVASLVEAVDDRMPLGGYTLLDPADQILWLTEVTHDSRLSVAILDAFNARAHGWPPIAEVIDNGALYAALRDVAAERLAIEAPAGDCARPWCAAPVVRRGGTLHHADPTLDGQHSPMTQAASLLASKLAGSDIADTPVSEAA